MKEPEEGVTKCDCGCKYWDPSRDGDGWRCHSCGWYYQGWTHKTAAGTRCRIIAQDKDRVLIQKEDSDGYWNYRYSRLIRIQEDAR